MNKRPIIIDTDSGIGDVPAIVIALFSDELDVRPISTATGNIGLDRVTYNALRLLKYLGRENVPVVVGASRLLTRKFGDINSVHGKSGMEGFDLEGPTQQPLRENVVDAIRNVIMNNSEPVTLVPIAPLTDIALLLKTHPEVKRNIREIILMGGSASYGSKGIMTELNITLDPEAAHVVFHSGVKLTMAGLDVGLGALVLPEDSEEIHTMSKTGEMVYCLLKKYRGGSFRTGLKMYDAAAVTYLLKPELFGTVGAYLDVELYGTMTAGRTLADLEGYLGKGPNATTCLDIDGDAFRMWLKEVITKCRQSV